MNNVLPWFALKSVPGIGNLLFKRLIDRFRSPEGVFQAPVAALSQVPGISAPVIRTLQQGPCVTDDMQREIDRARQRRFRIVTLNDPDYPQLLAEIPDPPPFLFVHGRLDDHPGAIAIVGSRNATDYGIRTTHRLSRDLALNNAIVVSGMARGIDTAAHTGAITGRGQTIAVLGSGLEKIYPAENRKLFHQIAENGAVVSEFALTADPEAHHFPMRNRVISGICLGTVIVEATRRSGSLITARLAAEQNREVFAVPGSIRSFKSTGTHTLIKQGAKLVEHARDILEEFPRHFAPGLRPSAAAPGQRGLPVLTADEKAVCRQLGPYEIHIDDLSRKTAMAPGQLASLLLGLELKGVVRQLPGKLFSLSERDGLDLNP